MKNWSVKCLCVVVAVVFQSSVNAETILYYEFEEGPIAALAGTVLDSGPQTINGAAGQANAGNIPRYVNRLPGRLQLEFDGSGGDAGFIAVADPGVSPLDLTGPITVEAIISASTIQQQVIARKLGGLGGNGGFILEMTAAGRIGFAVDNDTNLTYSTTVLDTDKAYHVAGTWDGSTIRVYVNQIDEAQTAFSDAITTNDSSLGIGAILRDNGTVGQGFSGLIDEVRISDMVLDSSSFLPTPAPLLAVPEPSSLALATIAFLSLLGMLRRRGP